MMYSRPGVTSRAAASIWSREETVLVMRMG